VSFTIGHNSEIFQPQTLWKFQSASCQVGDPQVFRKEAVVLAIHRSDRHLLPFGKSHDLRLCIIDHNQLPVPHL
jgi:hypothetical protein